VTTRTLFLGTPAFAVPSLDALASLGGVDVVGVVTQPDRAGHRGRVTAPPTKERAVALGLPLLQPARLDSAALREIERLRPELLVWAAYGNLIPRALLDAVGERAVNVHASLLPRWRGAAPMAHAILAGDAETGVTLMHGTPKLDAGPILAQERIAIGDETAGELTVRLAALGASVLARELPRYIAGELVPRTQDEGAATWAPKLDPRDGALDFQRPGEELARRVRAFSPDPGAFTTFRGRRVIVSRASVTGGSPDEHGILRLRDGTPHVATGAGWLRLDEVRPAGKRTMTGAEWARGHRNIEESRVPS